ncbi:hypothetical protein Tco_1139047, partial [Tanacetum coccineum]
LNLENLPQQPMRNQGIAKVELAPGGVGLKDSDGVLFVGARVEGK